MSTTYRGTRSSGLSRKSRRTIGILIAAIVVLCIALALFLLRDKLFSPKAPAEQAFNPSVGPTLPEQPEKPEQTTEPEQTEDPSEEVPPEPVAEDPSFIGPLPPPAEPEPEEPEEEGYVYIDPELTEPFEDFDPHFVESTDPAKHMKSTEIIVNGEIVENFELEEDLWFGLPSEYTELSGVTAFRGNNFRNTSSCGTAELTEYKFGDYWTQPIGALQAPDGSVWTGSGWTGQPIIVSWPKETRAIMNMEDWAKEAEQLVEVITPTMDGYVYFNELETGKPTREKLWMGYTFKGCGCIDPRGYPLLYLGSGYNSKKGNSHAFIVSLIDCTILYEYGKNDSFAYRGFSGFDGCATVDPENDMLITPGENGILYIHRLHTQYDPKAGTISVDPELIRWRYQGNRNGSYKFWYGMEDSPVLWQGHLIIADNGGYLMCLDLKTLTLDWVQDVVDDTNCSPVLELEHGHPYLYISTSFHMGWNANQTFDVPMYKIDAETGEIVWELSVNCYTADGLSGGAEGTAALGKRNLSEYVYFPMAKANHPGTGDLVCCRKDTGEVVWTCTTDSYSWGSPTIVYDQNGDGYLIYGCLESMLYLVDGKTGKILDSMNVGAHVEATAAIYNNIAVIGTRTNFIYGITLK